MSMRTRVVDPASEDDGSVWFNEHLSECFGGL